ncbi:MAG TPA: hypothetical protein PLD79_05660 [Halothiobacillus sp.]|nr:MAG: hypothetical protein B7Z82_05075 [Halothiobacillus sp. 20-54-6]HQT43463.1 hypothetical protein [Halothiobacillus sp.]
MHEIDLEHEQGAPVWSIAIQTQAGKKEVLVDAQSGAIVATTVDNERTEHEGKDEQENDDHGQGDGASDK